MGAPIVPKAGFTDRWLDNLKPQEKRYEVRDRGLSLRVSPGGSKTWCWYFKEAGKVRRLNLGNYPKVGLSEARDKLNRARDRHRNGENPEIGDADVKTVTDLAEVFYQRRILPKRRRPDAVRDVLDRDVLPAIGTRKLSTLSTPALADIVDAVVDRGATNHAGRVLATMKQMFSWAESRGYIDRSPAVSLKVDDFGIVAEPKDRTLNHDEINALWNASLKPHIALTLKILLLTGVRAGELLNARWRDLEGDTWHVPAGNSKTGRAWDVALSRQAQELFEDLRDLGLHDDWIMPNDKRDGPLSSGNLSCYVARIFKQVKSPLRGHEPWSAHDLRRTCRTGLADLGVDFVVAEKCLNHSLGKIHKTYDQHDYLDERLAALQRWADQVDVITGTAGANVVSLEAGR